MQSDSARRTHTVHAMLNYDTRRSVTGNKNLDRGNGRHNDTRKVRYIYIYIYIYICVCVCMCVCEFNYLRCLLIYVSLPSSAHGYTAHQQCQIPYFATNALNYMNCRLLKTH